MKLLTKAIREKLPPLYSQEHNADPMVIVKFFHPVGSWTWFATEASVYRLDEDGNELTLPMTDWQEGDDVLFFGLVKGFEDELGYFTLKELESVVGPLGLGIERDTGFKPRLLSEVRKGVASARPWGPGSPPTSGSLTSGVPSLRDARAWKKPSSGPGAYIDTSSTSPTGSLWRGRGTCPSPTTPSHDEPS